MNKKQILFCFWILCYCVKAQELEVMYIDRVEMKQGGEVKILQEYEYKFLMNQDKSVYKPINTTIKDSISQTVTRGENNTTHYAGKLINANYSIIYLDLKSNIKWNSFRVNSDHTTLTKSTIETPDWQFHEETKKIGKYICKLATLKESNIRVWYTEEIPSWSSPRGLTGLPGLVLDFTQNKRHVFVKDINFKPNSIKIEPPAEGTLVEAGKRKSHIQNLLLKANEDNVIKSLESRGVNTDDIKVNSKVITNDDN